MTPPFARTWDVRGYEVSADRTPKATAMLSWLEQLRWEWILDEAWGLRQLVDDGQFFVVRRQVLQPLAPVGVV